ncbi:DUF6776 family protein [Ferrimonas balearica]|uniref:DUF6776 family protein n=1 Tax=Ferrimonas balearica TaxID=44012 RepID=UPI001C99E126|nr:DUF6776 family protein [Ferrimonas balearica]MBY5992437.1 hypothetical protein [Ferrimonas balearica]
MQKWKHRWHALSHFEQRFKPRGLVLLLAALGFILVGYGIGYLEQWALHQQVDLYQDQKKAWAKQRLTLEKELATRALEIRMEHQSQLETRDMMARQREQMQALETELAFYRNIMAPEKSADGVQIHDFVLDETADADRFRFRLVLTQQKIRKRFAKGNVTLTLHGSERGQPVSRNLTAMGVENDALRFSFRYFQQIESDFSLPADFMPERLVVQVRVSASSGQRAASTETSYPFSDLVSQPTLAQLTDGQ